MKNFISLVSLLLVLLIGCTSHQTKNLIIHNNSGKTDTLFISDMANDTLINKITLDTGINSLPIKLPHNLLASVSSNNLSDRATILSYFKTTEYKTIVVDNAIKTKNNTCDSLLTYISTTTNKALAKNQRLIFGTNDHQATYNAFDSLRNNQLKAIRVHHDVLTDAEMAVLTTRINEGINSFLFFYGRILKEVVHGDPFYEFVKEIDIHKPQKQVIYPLNIVYTLEHQYLKLNDTVASVRDFVGFMREEIKDSNQSNFYVNQYLKQLIDRPSQLPKHAKAASGSTLKELIKEQSLKPYYYVLKRTANDFLATQAGEKAYNFIATNLKGDTIQLNQYSGKIIFIDNWATWCGPCIEKRPIFDSLATAYAENQHITFLAISVDEDQQKWKNYVARKLMNSSATDLHIPEDQIKNYRENLFISFIPKYTLIDRDGTLINANISDPLQEALPLITKHLNTTEMQ